MDALRQSIMRAQLAKPLPGGVQKSSGPRPADTAAIDERFAVLDKKLDTLIDMLKVPRKDQDVSRLLLPADVRRVVTAFFDVTDAELDRRRRAGRIARIRQVAFYLCRMRTTRSLSEIGRAFRRDHVTILHGVRRIAALRKADAALDDDLLKLEARLEGLLARRNAA